MLIALLTASMLVPLTHANPSPADRTIGSEADGVVASVRPDGSLSELRVNYPSGWQRVDFRSDEWAGPGFGGAKHLHPSAQDADTYEGIWDGITYQLHYAVQHGRLVVTATIANGGTTAFAPSRLPLQLGIDTFMDLYPRWNDQYFPTFFRCEASHMSGYLMTPNGHILGVASPDAVASYSLEYQREMYAHFIYTVSLDLLQGSPLPAHQSPSTALAPGEKRSWSVDLFPIASLAAVPSALASASNAPFLNIERASLEPKQPATLQIAAPGGLQNLEIIEPGGTVHPTGPLAGKAGVVDYRFAQTQELGTYGIRAIAANGKVATGSFYVHPNWSWYLKQARFEALRLTPRADLQGGLDDYSCETHYGLLGFYLAAKHFPDPSIDVKGDRILNKVLDRLYREKDGKRFSGNTERVQNGTAMISILVLRYQATGDIHSLEMASEFAEFVLGRQAPQGYYGGYGMHPYTAVLYPAKSLMELMAAVKPLAAKDKKWKARYDRWNHSVERAMDDLILRGKNVNTEGGSTFEDGAVSCTSLQLGAFALLQTNPQRRQKYLQAAREVLDAHACLTRLLDPDSRSRGATSRFWEAWGDVHIPAQMMLSPHGWSGWRLYAEYYLYLLTGEESYLRNTFDGIGSGTQLIDWPSGRLRYAFIVDPTVDAGQWVQDPDGKSRYANETISEQYVNTIGDHYGRQTAGDNYMDRVEWAWVGDGPPFEILKAMEEIAANNAYVLERPDHTLLAYNCDVQRTGQTLTIQPREAIVTQVHLNLKYRQTITIHFANHTVSKHVGAGMQWILSASAPSAAEALRIH